MKHPKSKEASTIFAICPYCKTECVDLPTAFKTTDQYANKVCTMVQKQLRDVVADRDNLMQMNVILDEMVCALNDALERKYKSDLPTVVIERQM